MKTIEVDGGYIMMSEESEIDPDSIYEFPENKSHDQASEIMRTESNKDSSARIDIQLIKDGKIYNGIQKSFSLKETDDGKTKISVVFYLRP